ncbi:MAG: xanthine dehydrogenase family protein molybdopterin-binding subunit [Anaerolineales bacterium]|nr:xanthine dehydrogenase family protein molybdopterin-binding subunit [Anaerolineales bacterium]
MTELRVVGQPLPRLDAKEKVQGQAVFAADVQLPGLLVGKFLTSPHAHAEILSIDTSAAEILPGVRAVITAADIPASAKYDAGSRFHAFLARRFVVFAGQPVAAVAADDLVTAESALELIRVDYRPLPVVRTPQEAIQPGCVAVALGEESFNSSAGSTPHTQVAAASQPEEAEAKGDESPNIANRVIFKYGDLAAAFAQSDVIVEQTYTVPVVHQGYIEPHAVTAHWDRPDHVTVWECVQGAFAARDLLAHTLGLSQSSITLNATEIGGGFGGKVEGIFAPIVVLLAKKARRPVKLVLTRREELVGSNPAPHSVIRLKSGARKDGRLTALEGEILVDAGAFPSGWIMNSMTVLLRNNYKFPAWRLEGLEVLTHKASIAAYRAPGGPNAAFAIECQLDEMARRLDLDPLQLRLQNLVEEGDSLTDLEPQVRVGGREVLNALAGHPAWTDPLPARYGDNGLLYGRGLALGSWEGGRGPASAIAILDGDGKFNIVLGTVDLSGSFTSLAQIAAEALGVSVEKIVIRKASPDYAPFAPMSAGSQTIFAMGAAVKEAALDLRAKLFRHAAKELQVSEDELGIDGEGIFVSSQPNQRRSFETLYQLGTEWFAEYGPLLGQGSAAQRQRAPGFAATIAEVAVDPATGQVRVTRLTTAQDVGRAINPLAVAGQLQGGSTQSVGIALWEEVMYDEQGRVCNPNLLDYRLPTAADLPLIETIIVEAPGGDGPYGAKLVGEPSIIPPVAAVANAVAAAIGARICDLPLTPERVWRVIAGRNNKV